MRRVLLCLQPRLLHGVTWSLMNFAKAHDPNTKVILLKYRSQVVELAPVLKKALPNSKVSGSKQRHLHSHAVENG